MDRVEADRGSEESDGAEQAFAALRAEVAALRRGVELVYRQGQEATGSTVVGPDYSPTLGAIAKELAEITARLDAMERAPALATTPGQQAAELRQELRQIGEDARRGLASSQAELDGTVGDLRGIIASARAWREQKQWLWAVGAAGVMGGMLLWVLLTAALPWSGGTWLAGLAFGGRFSAGQAMLREADPATWDRMVRLYNACPQDSRTELCEAAIAVRTISPSASTTPEGPRVPTAGTAPGQVRGRSGQGR